MVFEVQRYLEDHFTRRGFNDPDQYAVRLANLYDRLRRDRDRPEFLKHMARVRTVFFRSNGIRPRRDFEESLLTDLDRRFKKKREVNPNPALPVEDTVIHAKRVLGGRRRTIRQLLTATAAAIESRAVDAFWVSRTKSVLKPSPESIAQSLLAVGLRGLVNERGLVLRELAAGTGYVDLAVVLARTLHLVEVKILTDGFKGVAQLGEYMRLEGRSEGWLVVFDARQPSAKVFLPEVITIESGTVRTIIADIHPKPASSL